MKKIRKGKIWKRHPSSFEQNFKIFGLLDPLSGNPSWENMFVLMVYLFFIALFMILVFTVWGCMERRTFGTTRKKPYMNSRSLRKYRIEERKPNKNKAAFLQSYKVQRNHMNWHMSFGVSCVAKTEGRGAFQFVKSWDRFAYPSSSLRAQGKLRRGENHRWMIAFISSLARQLACGTSHHMAVSSSPAARYLFGCTQPSCG